MKQDLYQAVRDATRQTHKAEETLKAGLKAILLGLFALGFGIWYSLVWWCVSRIYLSIARHNLRREEVGR